jgi:hypothetical protein
VTEKLTPWRVTASADCSFIFCKSSVPGLLFGKWHITDANQNIADPHAAAIATLSMNDRIIAPSHYYYIIISPSLVGNLYRQSDNRMVRCGFGTNETSQDLRSMAEIRAKAVRCSTLS